MANNSTVYIDFAGRGMGNMLQEIKKAILEGQEFAEKTDFSLSVDYKETQKKCE